jgi:hypothetical protein
MAGVFSVHTRIAVKPTGAPRFTHYEVFGLGVAAVLIDRMDRTITGSGLGADVARPAWRGC